jgi:hypothetical protein
LIILPRWFSLKLTDHAQSVPPLLGFFFALLPKTAKNPKTKKATGLWHSNPPEPLLVFEYRIKDSFSIPKAPHVDNLSG